MSEERRDKREEKRCKTARRFWIFIIKRTVNRSLKEDLHSCRPYDTPIPSSPFKLRFVEIMMTEKKAVAFFATAYFFFHGGFLFISSSIAI